MFDWEVEPNFLKFKHLDISIEIRRHVSLGFLMGYLLINKSNSLFGKQCEDLSVLFGDGVEITYADFSGEYWKIGVDFGHFNDYVPNFDIDESIVNSLRVFCEDDSMNDFFSDFDAWCQENKAKISDYKNIEYVSVFMKNLAEKVQAFQSFSIIH